MFWFIAGFMQEKKPQKDDSEFPASLVLTPAKLQHFSRAAPVA